MIRMIEALTKIHAAREATWTIKTSYESLSSLPLLFTLVEFINGAGCHLYKQI